MNGTRQVVMLVPFSFLVYVIGNSEAKNAIELPDAKGLIAWGLLFLVLIFFGDLEQTGMLAAALAWLIAFTVFLTYGTGVVDHVSKWIGE